MSRSQLNLRIPAPEKASVQEQARGYGISMSAYLRILAIEDRERRDRGKLLSKTHPQNGTLIV